MEKLWISCKGKLIYFYKEEQGSVFLLSLFILIMLGAWGTTTLVLSTNEYSISHTSSKAIQAYYLAEAGIEEAIIQIKEQPTLKENFTKTVSIGKYTVTYTEEANNIVNITSWGNAGKAKKRLQAKLQIVSQILEDQTVKYEIKLIDWW